jgi:biopolymer transport protein ExbD
MNLTPTIDVTFLLLIFFVCQLRFRQLDGTLDTFLPRDTGAARSRVDELLESVRIRLTRESAGDPAGSTLVAVNGRVLERLDPGLPSAAPELPRLEGALRTFREKWPELVADLDPDAGIPAGHVVAVLDAAIAAGLPAIRFTLPPPAKR